MRLHDGSVVWLRPIRPDDRDALQRGLGRLSEEARYTRFFGPMPQLSQRMLRYLTDVDHHDHEAIVAVDPATGEGLGVARYIRLEPDGREAEIAVTVLDDWQGRGLGRMLLEAVADRAREEGVDTLTASVLAQNPGAMHVISALGDDAGTTRHGQVVELRVALPEEEGIGSDLGALLQAAAAGSIVVVGAVLRAAAGGGTAVPHGERAPVPAAGAPTRIVVGSDGSASADRAVAEAATLAAGLGASLHVVSAYYGLAGGVLPRGLRSVPEGLSDLGWMVASKEDAGAVVDAGRRTALAVGVEATGEVRRGDPASVLVTVAGEQDADLVVVGSKGLRGARRYLLGGVADKVVRHAPCSVLIARTG